MRAILLLALVLVACSGTDGEDHLMIRSGSSGAVEYTEVWFILGASNAHGAGANQSGLTQNYSSPTMGTMSLRLPQSDVLYSMKKLAPGASTLDWAGLQPTLGGLHGPEILFGRKLSDARRKVAIIRWSEASTNLAADFLGPPDRYGQARDWFRAQLATLPPPWRVAGVFFVCGGDADTLAHKDAYPTNHATFIQNFRNDFGANLPFIDWMIHPDVDPTLRPYAADVRAMTEAGATLIIDQNGIRTNPSPTLVNCYAVDTPDSPLNGDGLHLGSPGEQSMGTRAATLMLTLPRPT